MSIENSLNIVTMIQARTTSSRLPNKVMKPICGKPLLLHMVERVKKSKLTSEVVVITTYMDEDDLIQEICLKNNIQVYRGHPSDLLDRHYQAALYYEAGAVVKIPSDCPLIDPEVIDRVLKLYLKNYPRFDYVSNLHPASYPDGNDVEIMSFDTLEKSWRQAKRHFEREHTTPYIWENPDQFRIGNVMWESGFDISDKMRWTIDYEEDFIFIKTIYEFLYKKNPDFGMYEILELLEKKPSLLKLNSSHLGEYWYDNHIDELNNIQEYKSKLTKESKVEYTY